jgi:hypothetical protein
MDAGSQQLALAGARAAGQTAVRRAIDGNQVRTMPANQRGNVVAGQSRAEADGHEGIIKQRCRVPSPGTTNVDSDAKHHRQITGGKRRPVTMP